MIRSLILAHAIAVLAASVALAELRWRSAALKEEVTIQVVTPSSPEASREGSLLPTVVYLKGLASERVGRATDAAIVADLTLRGHVVLVIDYARHREARSPLLNADALLIRQSLCGRARDLLPDVPIDPDRLFVVAEGFTVRRDVVFARDGQRVLGMDLIHPVDPVKAIPLLLEISCDNVHRMGSASLIYCHDTLLDGASAAGFAAAMVDHPVAPPYKGLDDPMPECLERVSAAIAKSRALARDLGLSARVGAIGFSRGAPFAAIAALRREVDAALVHGNRFDYLNLLPTDPMRERFEQAWGPLAANRQRWAAHGAVSYIDPAIGGAPMFLSTSDAESLEYRHGLRRLAEALGAAGIDHVYREDADGRGHRVTTDPARLDEIYAFFRRHLDN